MVGFWERKLVAEPQEQATSRVGHWSWVRVRAVRIKYLYSGGFEGFFLFFFLRNNFIQLFNHTNKITA